MEEQDHEQLAPSSSSDLLGSGGRPGTAKLEWPRPSGQWRPAWHSRAGVAPQKPGGRSLTSVSAPVEWSQVG